MAIKAVSNTPHFVVTSEAIGDVAVRILNMGDLVDLEKQQPKEGYTAKSFVDAVMQRVGSTHDGASLTSKQISALTNDERAEIVKALISDHPTFFGAKISNNESEADDGKIVQAEGETDEEFFLRGWRNQGLRFMSGMKKTLEAANALGKGLGLSMRQAILPALSANTSASARLGEQIKNMSLGTSPTRGRITNVAQPKLELPYIPPNPAIKTNAILSEVAGHIADMRDLAGTTAEMQQSLNEVAKTILNQFSEGAASAAESSRDALRIARIGMWVAIVSAILTLIALIVAIVLAIIQSDDQNRQRAAFQAARTEEVVVQKQNTAALTRYADALDRQQRRSEQILKSEGTKQVQKGTSKK